MGQTEHVPKRIGIRTRPGSEISGQRLWLTTRKPRLWESDSTVLGISKAVIAHQRESS